MKKKKTVGNKINKLNSVNNTIRFPRSVLQPVYEFLNQRLTSLYINRKKIASEDPFKVQSRVLDNASPDADAEEQFGHARVSAIKEELNLKSKKIKKALERIKNGEYGICEDCGNMIDTDRLAAIPEASLCATCAKKREK